MTLAVSKACPTSVPLAPATAPATKPSHCMGDGDGLTSRRGRRMADGWRRPAHRLPGSVETSPPSKAGGVGGETGGVPKPLTPPHWRRREEGKGVETY
eukprot:scaffold3486_cov118-Isochrysis_galbana.AAC.5